MKGVFVTGTDTEVGKTRVAAGLVHALRARGLRVAPVKPLAAGQALDAQGHWFNEDVRWLHAAQGIGLREDEVGPFQWREACAPHIAARLEGRPIEPAAVLAAVRALAHRTDRVDALVVEGVGGFCVPLAPGWDSADLTRDLGLPVVLVVGLRLGCLNHAALSAEAVRARGLHLAGWVGNALSPAMPHLEDNLAALRERLGAPCLGTVPHLSSPTPAAVAAHLNPSPLIAGWPELETACSTRS